MTAQLTDGHFLDVPKFGGDIRDRQARGHQFGQTFAPLKLFLVKSAETILAAIRLRHREFDAL